MLQNTRKAVGFKKIMVFEIPTRGAVNHIGPAVYIIKLQCFLEDSIFTPIFKILLKLSRRREPVIVVYDIKVGRCCNLREYMNPYEYQRSKLLSDLSSRSLRFNMFKLFFLEISTPIEAKFYMKSPWIGERKFSLNGLGHMT